MAEVTWPWLRLRNSRPDARLHVAA
jgi:hypothetical protein